MINKNYSLIEKAENLDKYSVSVPPQTVVSRILTNTFVGPYNFFNRANSSVTQDER